MRDRVPGAYDGFALNAAQSFRRLAFMRNDICFTNIRTYDAYDSNHLYWLSRAQKLEHGTLCADEIARK